MIRRPNGGDSDGQDNVNEQLKQLFEDDEFLSALSRGVDPSEGEDALAGLLLDMNKEVNADMPATPDLSVLLPVVEEGSADADPGTTEFAPITVSENTDDADTIVGGGAVVPLGARRDKRARRGSAPSGGGVNRRKSHPFLHGLVGAAAATLVIAGGGTAIYNADADSPLYGLSTSLFGKTDTPSVVELASTLEEVDSRTASGDVEGARELLEQARTMLATMDERQRNTRATNAPAPLPTTQTVTATVTQVETPEPPAPETTTETVRETATATQTVVSTVVQPPVWIPDPTQVIEPPVPTTTGQVSPVPGDGTEPGGNNGGNNGGENNGGGEVAPPQFLGEQ